MALQLQAGARPVSQSPTPGSGPQPVMAQPNTVSVGVPLFFPDGRTHRKLTGLSLGKCSFEPYREGSWIVSDPSKKSGLACPRCKTTMDEVVRIAPLGDEPGLIAYECPACRYVTSVFWQPKEP